MTTLETRKYEMLVRVREFGANHPDLFPTNTRGGELLTGIDAVVNELSAQITAQQTGAGVARSGASNRAAVRERVIASLDAIRRTAREIAADVPGVDGQFRMPRSGRDQAVLGAARTFVANAEPLKPLFARHMLGDEFFGRLANDVAAFEQALSIQRRGREARVAATAAIQKAISRGMRTVRSIDTLLRNRFGGDAAELAAWKHASRVHSPAVRGASSGAHEPPSTGAAA